MRRISLSSLSATVINNVIYTLIRKSKGLTLQILDRNLKVIDEINMKGRRGFILKVEENKILASVDNKLYLIENGQPKVVLVASKPRNIFWHLAEVERGVFVQEYGEPPTGIFVSNDLRDWERIVTNLDVDKSSKHFHNIAYDPYRKWLISTLGDGNLIRVAISEDLGSSWKPLYKGPWQFVPIVVTKDRLVFGMDSGIVRGGVGIFDPTSHKWSFIFLKWCEKDVKHAQMCDLKLLDNVYIAGLGTPQAIVASEDLKTWHLIHAEEFDERFNIYISMSEEREFIVCSTGKSLLLLTKDELDDLRLTKKPIMVRYGAYIGRLKGFGFNLKYKALL